MLQNKALKCGTTVYFKGLPLEMGPLPAFFYFSLSGHDSLCLEPFNQPASFLQGDDLRIFSISLPYHDEENKRQVMKTWAKKFQEGHDFITPFIDSANQAIEELIDIDVIDGDHLAVGGLSRGSFIATHLAARSPRIKALLGFAPLTRLNVSASFREFLHAPLLDKLNIFHLMEPLQNTAVRFYIGNRDTMVQTTACFDFVRQLTDSIYDSGCRSPQVELIISPSIGHKGHGTPSERFKDGAHWIKTQLEISR